MSGTIWRNTSTTARSRGLVWMYFLVLIPALTDFIETGGLPRSPREWVTEVVVGAVIAALVRQVRKEQFSLRALARTDHLTGLLNRSTFMETIADETARAARTLRPLTLVYLDLDNFKALNDSAGHDAGDRALAQLATAIRDVVRARIDRGFRVGGDEFALLLPDSSAQQAALIVQRIWQRCTEIDPQCFVDPLGMSAGVVGIRAGETAADFVRRADQAMYQRKQARRAAGTPAIRPR